MSDPREAMTTQINTRYRLSSAVLAVLLGGTLAIGCGGTGHASSAAAPSSTSTAKKLSAGARASARIGALPQPAGDQPSSQNAAIAQHDKAACEQAVQSAPALAAAAKDEIGDLCFSINYIPEDNERTVRAVCQEVANASSLASDAARKRTAAACYAAGMG